MTEAIVQIIEEMVAIHRTLNALAKEKTDAVIKGDFKTLDRIINREEAETARLSQLEQKRMRLVEEATGLPGERATFSALIEAAPEEERERLRDLQKALAHEVFHLKAQNDLNQDLLKQSLEWVELNQKLFMPALKSPTYTHPRAEKETDIPTLSRFDTRA